LSSQLGLVGFELAALPQMLAVWPYCLRNLGKPTDALILAPLALWNGAQMTYNSNFDVDAVMKMVGTVSAKYPKGSPEDEALRIVSVALLYVSDIQKLDEYRDYFRRFFTYKPIIVSQTFATREEADQWLASGQAKDGDLVKIAGRGFVVYDLPKGLRFVPMPLPEELNPPPDPPPDSE
jgi:hypothetical protein